MKNKNVSWGLGNSAQGVSSIKLKSFVTRILRDNYKGLFECIKDTLRDSGKTNLKKTISEFILSKELEVLFIDNANLDEAGSAYVKGCKKFVEGKNKQALYFVNKALKKDYTDDFLFLRSCIYSRAGEYERAMSDLEVLLNKDKESIANNSGYAKCMLEIGNRKQAFSFYKKSLENVSDSMRKVDYLGAISAAKVLEQNGIESDVNSRRLYNQAIKKKVFSKDKLNQYLALGIF